MPSGGVGAEGVEGNMWTAIERSMRTELENALKVSPDLLTVLEQHEPKVFTSEDRSEVSALVDSKAKVQKIIAVLQAKQNVGYQCLVEALTSTSQRHLLPCGDEGKVFLCYSEVFGGPILDCIGRFRLL